jgi:hypothetical protein
MYTFSTRAIRRTITGSEAWAASRPIPVCHPRKRHTDGRLRHFVAGHNDKVIQRLEAYADKLMWLYRRLDRDK